MGVLPLSSDSHSLCYETWCTARLAFLLVPLHDHHHSGRPHRTSSSSCQQNSSVLCCTAAKQVWRRFVPLLRPSCRFLFIAAPQQLQCSQTALSWEVPHACVVEPPQTQQHAAVGSMQLDSSLAPSTRVETHGGPCCSPGGNTTAAWISCSGSAPGPSTRSSRPPSTHSSRNPSTQPSSHSSSGACRRAV